MLQAVRSSKCLCSNTRHPAALSNSQNHAVIFFFAIYAHQLCEASPTAIHGGNEQVQPRVKASFDELIKTNGHRSMMRKTYCDAPNIVVSCRV